MERIHIWDLKNKIRVFMQEIGFPSSVCFTFLDNIITREEKFSLFVYEIIKENGVIRLNLKNSNDELIDNSYGIIFDPNNKKCIINSTFDNKLYFCAKSSHKSFEHRNIVLEYNKNAFNNEPGYIITISGENTSFYDDTYTDVSFKYIKVFDENGIEVCRKKITNNFLPRNKKYENQSFRYTFLNNDWDTIFFNRVPFSTSEMITYREGVVKAVSYYQEIDYTGDIIKKDTYYYHLSGEHGYATMKIDFPMTKEEYDQIGIYNDKELIELIDNDEYRDILFNKYCVSRDSYKKLVL